MSNDKLNLDYRNYELVLYNLQWKEITEWYLKDDKGLHFNHIKSGHSKRAERITITLNRD